jgi:malate dehydrogenase (oxaloacetate-decarboxylating)
MAEIRIVINGAGAAGVAIARLLRKAGAQKKLDCDSKAYLHKSHRLTEEKREFAVKAQGTLAVRCKGRCLIGVSAPGVLTPEMYNQWQKMRSSLQWQIRFPKFSQIGEL